MNYIYLIGAIALMAVIIGVTVQPLYAFTKDFYTTKGHHHCTKGESVPKNEGKCTFEGR